MNFMRALKERWSKADSLVCVGLDPEPSKFPDNFARDSEAIFDFCKEIVDATAEYACAFKPQIAYFSAHAAETALQRLIEHIHVSHPTIPVILDAKRGDIGSTAQQYAAEAFDRYAADALTVNPYLGRDSAQAYLDHADKGVVVLCRTSNQGTADLQDLQVRIGANGQRPFYQQVAEIVAGEWNGNNNCALVVGATWPTQLGEVRSIVGDMPLLIPGIGEQGGDVEAAVKNAKTRDGTGFIVSSSRAISYASQGADYAAAAAKATRCLRDEINRFR